MAATPEQLNDMVNYLMGFANEMLTKAGEFFPFAALVNPLGGVEAIGAHTGDEHPPSQQVYNLLISGLRSKVANGEAIAIGIATDVYIPPEFESSLSDGVRITLETEGNSRLIYYPYEPAKRGIFKKSPPKFLEPFAVEVPPDLFTP